MFIETNWMKKGHGPGGIIGTTDDDDDIAYFYRALKTRELVLSTAPKTRDNTDKDSKNRKRSH